MLQAKSNNGAFVTLARLTVPEIENIRKNHQFYCPSCNQQVIIKAGTKIIPHFAHLSKVNCPSNEGGEGAYHEKGKLMLYQWLRAQNLQVNLEVYIKEINQRPDILLIIDHRRIAIEFQCARISIKQIQKRNKGYRQAGITPIWILGANRFKRNGQYHLKADQFTQQFMHQFSLTHPLKLIYFCPDTLQLTTIQDLYFTKKEQVIGHFSFQTLRTLRFTDIFFRHPFSKRVLYDHWKKEKERFRLQPRKHLFGREREWQQWLYLKQTHIEFLPSSIFLPVATQYLMHSSPWDWQSRLCLDIIDPLPIGSHFSMKSCENILQGHIQHRISYPLVQSTESPIREYLLLLEKLKIIKQKSRHYFVKSKPIEFFGHIEKSIKGDRHVMNMLKTNNINKIQA